MGVLKVNVGTAGSPDWRNIGCGGGYVIPQQWTFESVNDWVVLSGNATLSLTTATADEGTHSLAINRTGGGDVEIRSPFMDALPGQEWRALASVNCGTNPTFPVRPDVVFYDGSGTQVGGAFGGFNPFPAGTWIRTRTTSSIAPSGTVYAALRYYIDSGGAGSTQYLDRALLGLAGSYATGGFSFNNSPAAGEWTDLTPVATTTTGRLKLWDGTRWVREVCDDDPTGTPLFTDDFNRANTASGGVANGWLYCGIDFNPAPYSGSSKPDDWQIQSNQLYCATHTYLGTLSEGKLKGIVQSTTTPDFDLSITAKTTYAASSGANTGIALRRNTTDGSFLWWTPDAMWRLSASGVQTTVEAFALSLTTGDVVRITAVGNNFTFYKNGTSVHTATYTANNSSTCTQHGPMNSQSFAAPAIWDDFQLTDPAAVERHPLKMWDGSTWQTVACMTPA